MSEEQQQGQQGQQDGNDEQDGGQQANGQHSGADDLTGLRSALEKERKDRREFERRFKELDTKWRQREQQDMSEAERTAQRLKDYEGKEQSWEREKRDLRLQTALTAAGTKAGALYPEQLHRLVDADAIEWNDNGQPKNLVATVNGLKTEYPALFRTHGGAGNADAGAGSGAQHAETSMNTLIRRASGHE